MIYDDKPSDCAMRWAVHLSLLRAGTPDDQAALRSDAEEIDRLIALLASRNGVSLAVLPPPPSAS